MKIRTGFVSNSSSASFCVPKVLLTVAEQQLLLSYNTNNEEFHDQWDIYEDNDNIVGHTTMDNGELSEWLEKNGFNKTRVKIERW